MNVSRNQISNVNLFARKTKITFRTESNLPDEELKKLLRRAVKNVAVPAGYETRLMNLLAK